MINTNGFTCVTVLLDVPTIEMLPMEPSRFVATLCRKLHPFLHQLYVCRLGAEYPLIPETQATLPPPNAKKWHYRRRAMLNEKQQRR